MTTSIFGSVVRRVEDPRFLTGTSRYVDDLRVEGALRACFVRSIMAHARVLGIATREAAGMPGVADVLVAGDLDLAPQPPADEVEGLFDRPVLAADVVRYVGIAQALFEEVVYDELGTPITSNLTSYLVPAATELPAFETSRTETPTPLNPLGAKGIGESATVGSTPAVVNAVVDALAHLGVRHVDPPLSPERVWRAIVEANR